MRQRIALLALLVLGLGACATDAPPDQGASAPTTPATAKPRPSRPAPKAPPGVVSSGDREAAPDLRVTAFDGRTVTLGAFRGRPVVVNFFESW